VSETPVLDEGVEAWVSEMDADVRGVGVEARCQTQVSDVDVEAWVCPLFPCLVLLW
jgi:hypothetical protein